MGRGSPVCQQIREKIIEMFKNNVPQIPLFHQGSSSAGSEPEPSFKPVLCLSTPKAPAPNQEKRFVSSTKTLLG